MADVLIKFYKNKKLDYFAQQADDFYEKLLKPHLRPQILKKIEEHKKQGHYLVIVSGSIRYYLEPVVKDLGFNNIICTDLEEGPDGLLTGKPIGKICLGDYKRELAQKLADKEYIDLKNSFAYGDNESDIPLLNLVGNPIAVQPAPKLRKLAQKNNWKIINIDN
jgi:HAD superfamily hydrolase (TIGR01490 family)